MSEIMGYRNAERVNDISSQGKLSSVINGKVVFNNFADTVLTFMALNTYDYPPSDDVKKRHLPCRYYTLGWRAIAEAKGLLLMSSEESMSSEAAHILERKEHAAKTRISQAWKFLKEQKLIRTIVPASLGKNAGILLLLSDDKSENYECEKYARECLGLPYPDVEELREYYL